MNALLIPFILGIILVIVLLVILPQWRDADNKTQAQKILEFRNTAHSCSELKRLYLEQYNQKYNSANGLKWYWEVRDKLVKQCVDLNQLNDIEFIEICHDSGTTGCELSKLQNPELYENFNFRTAIKNLKPMNGSEN